MEAFDWYRRQRFYDPRRAMALRAWIEGDLRLSLRLLEWTQPNQKNFGLTNLETNQKDSKNLEKNWSLQAA